MADFTLSLVLRPVTGSWIDSVSDSCWHRLGCGVADCRLLGLIQSRRCRNADSLSTGCSSLGSSCTVATLISVRLDSNLEASWQSGQIFLLQLDFAEIDMDWRCLVCILPRTISLQWPNRLCASHVKPTCKNEYYLFITGIMYDHVLSTCFVCQLEEGEFVSQKLHSYKYLCITTRRASHSKYFLKNTWETTVVIITDTFEWLYHVPELCEILQVEAPMLASMNWLPIPVQRLHHGTNKAMGLMVGLWSYCLQDG